ncbi:MAG: hypothetical protein CL758_04905 [Chloroflexi bacterium]|nr:hypothetical protein [Chloroflexota bacterium]|tara:strand:+ start:40051 stop:41484 length:1434 start_codon:yes stop_codon:yes gene_type:complete
MNENIKLDQIIERLPDEWHEDLIPEIIEIIKKESFCLAVIDDDPAGTQAVADVTVMNTWDYDSILELLNLPEKALFFNTNNRTLNQFEAREIIKNTIILIEQVSDLLTSNIDILYRFDSTLRGHFKLILETHLQETKSELNGVIFVPYFSEGRRYTINNIQYVTEYDSNKDEEILIPVSDSEFSKDKNFSYTNSNLINWVSEQLGDIDYIKKIKSISIDDIRKGGPDKIQSILNSLSKDQLCIVNAISMKDIEVVAYSLMKVKKNDKKFLYITASSFIRVLLGQKNKPFLNRKSLNLKSNKGALIVVGSYVEKTNQQLKKLLESSYVFPIQINIENIILKNQKLNLQEIYKIANLIDQNLKLKKNVVIYTNRKFVKLVNCDSREIGVKILQCLVNIIDNMQIEPNYIICKGSTTADYISKYNFKTSKAKVLGQVVPGVSVWELGLDSSIPYMKFVVFAGNVGDNNSLVEVVENLSII